MNVFLKPLEEGDAAFLLKLLNTEDYLKYIGDRGVRTLEQAQEYLENYFLASQRQHGFGYYTVRKHQQDEPAGMVGLMKRDHLENPDIGFAFLPESYGQGLAYKASRRLIEIARHDYALTRLDAFTDPANRASQRLLQKLGFVLLSKPSDDTKPEESFSYTLDLLAD